MRVLALFSLVVAQPPPLIRSTWGQRWGYAQDAPPWPSNCSNWTPPCPRDEVSPPSLAVICIPPHSEDLCLAVRVVVNPCVIPFANACR